MQITHSHRCAIEKSIRDKYRRVASGSPGQFRFPTGRPGLEAMGYPAGLLDRLPEGVLQWYCGVGDPLTVAGVNPGERLLDVGCGAGVDTCLGAVLAGGQGAAVGVDASPEMLAQARANAQASGLGNTLFVQAGAQQLPFAEASFDVLVSNGVYNLVVDKPAALAEALRVLKPGGRLQIADQMLVGPAPASEEEMVASWFC